MFKVYRRPNVQTDIFLTDDRQNVSNIFFNSFVGWEAYTSGEIAEYFLVDVGQENNSMPSTKTLAIDILST